MEVLWFFNNQMLGIGNAPAYVPAPQGYGDGSETGLMTMLTDDMCQLDARVADHQFHLVLGKNYQRALMQDQKEQVNPESIV